MRSTGSPKTSQRETLYPAITIIGNAFGRFANNEYRLRTPRNAYERQIRAYPTESGSRTLRFCGFRLLCFLAVGATSSIVFKTLTNA